jgi:hypothetical protein
MIDEARELGGEDYAVNELGAELQKMFTVSVEEFWSTDIGKHVSQSHIDLRTRILEEIEGFKFDASCAISSLESEIEDRASSTIKNIEKCMKEKYDENSQRRSRG